MFNIMHLVVFFHLRLSSFPLKQIVLGCIRSGQVEIHPYNYDAELLAFCAAKGIAVTAYASLGGQDKRDVLREDATVVAPYAGANLWLITQQLIG